MLDFSYIENQSSNVNVFYNNGNKENSFQLNNYGVQSLGTNNPTITATLTAGVRYFFRARMQNAEGDAGFVLKYKKPSQQSSVSSFQTDELSSLTLKVFSTHGSVPGFGDISQYPPCPLTTPDMDKLYDTSYSNTTLFGTYTSFNQVTTSLNWGNITTLQAAGITLPKSPYYYYFSTETTGIFTPKETGVYTFNITSDDGSDLLIRDIGTWQTWTKPRNKCNFVWMMCMSGGAGGSGGTSTLGGLGGASAAITTALFPANLIPDTLFVWPGIGGTGGSGSASTQNLGQPGGRSLVAVRQIPTNIYTFPGPSELLCSSGRSNWSTATVGEPGNGDSGIILPKLLTLGIWNSVNGRDRAGGDVTPLLGGTITCPGADGATSTGLNGNKILPINLGSNIFTPSINEGIGTTIGSQVGGNGQNGVWNWKPMFGTGGAGGGGGVGRGGNGGKGAYGCGGGGGGIGGPIGGSGGDGGDGLVIIVTF